MRFQLLAPLSMMVCITHAQPVFERTYDNGDYGSDVMRTSDDGFFMVGLSYVNNSALAVAIKTDANGMEEWTFVDPALSRFSCAHQTSDGGYILSATLVQDFESLSLVKLDPLGGVVWQRNYPETAGFDATYDLELASDEGFVAAGSIGSGMTSDIFVLRTDAAGEVTWSFHLDLGGGEVVEQVAIMPNGDYIIAGQVRIGSWDPQDLFLIRLNDQGDTLWTKVFDEIASDDEITGLCVASDGSSVLTGRLTGVGVQTLNVLLQRTDANGDVVWRQEYPTYAGGGMDIQQLPDGSFIVCDSKAVPNEVKMHLFHTDAVGSMDWERTYAVSYHCLPTALDQTLDGGFVILGSATFITLPASSHAEFYLVRTDASGYVGINDRGAIQPTGIFPNPADQRFEIDMDRARVRSVGLFEGSGRAVRTWSSTEEFSTTDLAEGLYSLLIEQASGDIIRSRLLIVH